MDNEDASTSKEGEKPLKLEAPSPIKEEPSEETKKKSPQATASEQTPGQKEVKQEASATEPSEESLRAELVSCEVKEEDGATEPHEPQPDDQPSATPRAPAPEAPSTESPSEPPKPLSKNQQKKAAKAARRAESLRAGRAAEKLRQKEKRRAAALAGAPLPSRKRLKQQGSMASSSSRQRVALDVSFDELMTESERKKALQQLSYSYAANRRSANPLQLYLTSFTGPTAALYDEQRLAASGGHWDVHRKEEHYADAFPREDLVYLTAESDNTLTQLDEGKVYVIGALVDKNRHKGLCEGLAAKAGVPTARLPIADHLDMATRKVLTINHVFEILLAWTESRDWRAALLKVIPQRKAAVPRQVDEPAECSEQQAVDIAVVKADADESQTPQPSSEAHSKDIDS